MGIVIGILAAFLAVITVRTLRFKPKSQPSLSQERADFDGDAAIHALGELVKCRTISYNDPALEDDAEFEKLISLLPQLYPHVFNTCQFRQFPHRGLWFCWKGKQTM